MYGNHFQDLETQTHCMLVPKVNFIVLNTKTKKFIQKISVAYVDQLCKF